MPSRSEVYIAGVGYSPLPRGGSSPRGSIPSLVSAATKALLDAGVTYDDLDKGVGCAKGNKLPGASEAFKAFDKGGITVEEVENGSELESSFYWVRDRGIRCLLIITVEESSAIAFVLVSDRFVGSRPYLNDSAACIREADGSPSKAAGQTGDGLHSICNAVWVLRGWSDQQDTTKEGHVYYKGTLNKTFEISRADAKAIPEWKQVEYMHDGKHRLRHNPARETKDISQEDFEAVRAVGKNHEEADRWTQFKRLGGDRASLAKL